MSPGVFISYRRSDSAATAGRIYDRLVATMGPARVFMDVDSITAGTDFARSIDANIASCRILLAVIGKVWLTAADERGRRRLDDADDYVVREIGAALRGGVTVIPVLVDGAAAPRAEQMPGPLAGLAGRQGIRVDHESFSTDIEKVLAVVEGELSGFGAGRHPADRSTATLSPVALPDERVRFVECHRSRVVSMAFSPDGRTLATAGAYDDAVHLWDPSTGRRLHTLRRADEGLWSSVDFGRRGDVLATVTGHGTCRLWDLRSNEEIRTFTHDNGPMTVVACGAGDRLATVGENTFLWNRSGDGYGSRWLGGDWIADDGAFDATGERFVTVGKGTFVWDAVTGRQIRRISASRHRSAAFSPDGRHLATGYAEVSLWNPDTGSLHWTWEKYGLAGVAGLAFNPGGDLLAAACGHSGVRLFDPFTGVLLGALDLTAGRKRVTGSAAAVAFSPDGAQLAVADDNGFSIWC